LHAAAKQGIAAAQNEIGRMAAEGLGVKRDYTKAVQWFRLAAKQGEPYAQANQGIMYLEGRGVAKDRAEAIAWLLKAAEKEQPAAVKILRELGVRQ
jgi:TPR repeat protein